jgi:hypothetical protein
VLLATAALSTAVVGGEAQGVLTVAMGMMSACAARDSPNMAKPRMVNPVSAPTAVRLLVSAITAATSLQSGSRAGASCPRCVSQGSGGCQRLPSACQRQRSRISCRCPAGCRLARW